MFVIFATTYVFDLDKHTVKSYVFMVVSTLNHCVEHVEVLNVVSYAKSLHDDFVYPLILLFCFTNYHVLTTYYHVYLNGPLIHHIS